MNFATANGAAGGGACSSGIVVDDSSIIDDTKPQLLNLNNHLATVWPQQQQQHLIGQDLLSSVLDGSSVLFPSANVSSLSTAGGAGGTMEASINASGANNNNNNNDTSPQSSCSNGGGGGNNSLNNCSAADGGDAEGVWSADIDQAFHEALQIYPPCGRRKIILSDEGKMYGRNELIARYIKIRCGKTRTRKQVSSHIQVLARKKQREHQARMKVPHHHHNQQHDGHPSPSDFGGMLSQRQQQQQLAAPHPSTSGSISPVAPHGGAADPSSVESNQSSSAFHHTNNISITSNANGIANGGGGGGASGDHLLALSSRSSAGGCAAASSGIIVDACGAVGDGGAAGGISASSSLLTTTTIASAATAAAPPPPTAHNLLFGMAPTNNNSSNNHNNVPSTVGHNRESIVDASTMHQKMLEAASAISNSVMSSMPPNPSSAAAANWPFSLNAQHLLGGIQMAASRPTHHDLYSSILGGLQQQQQSAVGVLKTDSPNNNGIGAGGLLLHASALPNNNNHIDEEDDAPMPCHSSASSFAIDNFTIASSRLILCGFTAYIEHNLYNNNNGTGGGMVVDGDESRVEIIKIPKISDAPLERIDLNCVQSKYPELLQELFRKGPTDAFFLVKCWANMHFNFGDQHNSLFAVDSFYESSDKFDIIVSTKVCSFGKEVVEKVEIYSPIDEEEEAKCSGVWHFRLEKSPMCEYMVRFISQLKKLQKPSLMNSVLENLTVLQIVTDKQNNNTLMVIAFMFEVREDSNIRDDGDDEIFTNIYRITE